MDRGGRHTILEAWLSITRFHRVRMGFLVTEHKWSGLTMVFPPHLYMLCFWCCCVSDREAEWKRKDRQWLSEHNCLPWRAIEMDGELWLGLLSFSLFSRNHTLRKYRALCHSKQMFAFLCSCEKVLLVRCLYLHFLIQQNTGIEEIQFPRVQRTQSQSHRPWREREKRSAKLMWTALVQQTSLVRGVDCGGPQLFVRMWKMDNATTVRWQQEPCRCWFHAPPPDLSLGFE